MEEIKVLKNEEDVMESMKQWGERIPEKIVAFYHGGLNAIITDRRLMWIHFFDRQVHRAYSVFDACNLINNKLYLFDRHMARFFTSIKRAGLVRPKSKDQIQRILFQMAAVIGESNLNFRLWCSRGGKDLDITTSPTEPCIFYCAAVKGSGVAAPSLIVDVSTVRTTHVLHNCTAIKLGRIYISRIESARYRAEIKGSLSGETKTTNYLLNCMAADEAAKKKSLAVIVDGNDYVLEGPVFSLGFVLKDRTLFVPPYDKALRSTTVDRILELVEQHCISTGLLCGVSRAPRKVAELKRNTVEMFVMGGNNIRVVRRWDDQLISTDIGPVAKKLLQLLDADKKNPEMLIAPPVTKL